MTVKPNGHLSIALRADRNDIALPEGRFYTQVVTARADYNFTPNVSWQNLQQYDNESRVLSVQSRYRWILKPGNDLFIVINRGVGKDVRRLARCVVRSRVVETAVHVPILSSPAGVVGIV